MPGCSSADSLFQRQGLLVTLSCTSYACDAHIMMQVRRPDRLPLAAAAWVTEVLGAKYAEPRKADMSEALAEEPPTAPLLLLLSPGGDPGAALARLAAEHGAAERLSTLTLGQGQVCCALVFPLPTCCCANTADHLALCPLYKTPHTKLAICVHFHCTK